MKLEKWISLSLFFLSFSIVYPQKIREEDLAPKYKDWLKLVSYIILPQEKEVFLQLKNDRDRDIFIETFWKQRDPTAGTPQNEYMDEHIRRFIYANENFKRGTAREGWMTDMGRIYILLGPPNSIERFEMQSGIHPCQVWYYYGDTKKGFPPQFAVIFYQRGGAGEYKLYNPVSDGPESLIIDNKDIDPTDYQTVYKKMKELAPTLTNVSFTLIPGQFPSNFQPSLSASNLLSNIFESPKKIVSPSYATNFLSYKGIVDVEYATNYVECAHSLSVLKDPVLDLYFANFSINPKKVSLDYYEPKDQYYVNYTLSVSLRKNEKIMFQYSKDYPLYFSSQEMEKVKSGGISIQDSFPILEGDYKLIVLLQNSVGKEFSYFERSIEIPENPTNAFLLDPVLGYDFKEEEISCHLPFKLEEKRLLVDNSYLLSPEEKIVIFFNVCKVSKSLWEEGFVNIVMEGTTKDSSIKKTIDISLKEYPFKEDMAILKTIPARELPPDYYRLRLFLKNGRAEIIDSKKLDFSISSIKGISHPNIFAKKLSLSNKFIFYYMLAQQADNQKMDKKADFYFKRLLDLAPAYTEGVLSYSKFLLRTKRFLEAIGYIERIKEDSQRKFDYFLIKGQALMGLGKYEEAIESLLEGNKIYNSDVRVLNSLGLCYLRLDKKEEAIRALKSSLSLNPQQKEIDELLKKIEGRKN